MTPAEKDEHHKFAFQRGVQAWAGRKGMSLADQVCAGLYLLEAVEVMRAAIECDLATDETFRGAVQIRQLSDGRQQAVMMILWTKDASESVERTDMMGGVGVTREEALEDLLDVVEGFAVMAGIMPKEPYWGMNAKEPLQA